MSIEVKGQTRVRTEVCALPALPDAQNPTKFSRPRKLHIVIAGLVITANSALGSSLPSGAKSHIVAAFSVPGTTLPVLLNSIYLIGFAIGPLFCAPLSEHVGRRPVVVGSFAAYTVFTLCCAVSPSFPALLVFRFLSGLVGATPNAVIGPLYADIFDEPARRGVYMALFMCATSVSPPIAPIISGYASTVSWQLTFWVGLALAAIWIPLVFMLPETYAPILRERLERRGDKSMAPKTTFRWRRLLVSRSWMKSWVVLFSSPFSMLVHEPVVLFTSLYLAFIYSILYLYFQIYPIIFTGTYGLSPAEVGLAMLPVAAGSPVALAMFIWYSSYYEKALKSGQPWAAQLESRRLPCACVGGPIVIASFFWLGATARPSIHVAVPAMSGLFFGTGYQIIFMAMLNYLGDMYREFSAPAQAAASTTRALVAVCLPLAAAPMTQALGVHWSVYLLGFIAVVLSTIPFAFFRYGESLRRNSLFCQKLSQI